MSDLGSVDLPVVNFFAPGTPVSKLKLSICFEKYYLQKTFNFTFWTGASCTPPKHFQGTPPDLIIKSMWISSKKTGDN
jgi:hypothetical protein